jgi:DNA-binding MarR family transcriptional regulator
MENALLASDLREVIGQLVRRLRAEPGMVNLTQGSVLGRLDRQGASCVSELAKAERVRPQSMAQTVAELELSEMVLRRPDPGDGRRSLVELTPKGRETIETQRRVREGWLAGAIAAGLSEAERNQLRDATVLLRRLCEWEKTD